MRNNISRKPAASPIRAEELISPPTSPHYIPQCGYSFVFKVNFKTQNYGKISYCGKYNKKKNNKHI
jgi:hypothetical protein